MSSQREQQMAQLALLLQKLDANLAEMNELLAITCLQGQYQKKLGLMHGALFMGAHRVFEDEAMREHAGEEAHETGQE